MVILYIYDVQIAFFHTVKIWKFWMPEKIVVIILKSEQRPFSICSQQGRWNELHHEKTCLQGLRPGKTQTSLLSFRVLKFWI